CDPPFAKIDLISCRNLLIYFTASLQKYVIPIFHYALTPKSFLWLGHAESIAGFSDLFAILDNAHKIYIKKNAPVALNLNFPNSTYVPGKLASIREPVAFAKVTVDTKAVAEQILQTEYPGVLINEEMEISQFFGRTSSFIEHAPGAPSYNLLKVARPEILRDLRMAIQMAKKQKVPIKKDCLTFKEGRKLRTFNLKVIPSQPSSIVKDRYYLILFEDVSASAQAVRKKKIGSPRRKASLNKRKDPYIIELENELVATQEYKHALIEKYETMQADLTSANEELQSTNEELQSANEEMETAKEELQSGNEELTTVNDELRVRSLEQIQTNDDLLNLLGSVQIPIVMLGNDRKIRRFTPLAGKALNLIPTDVGRPIGDLKFNFSAPEMNLNLDQLVSDVTETLASTELEVQDGAGRWYRLQSRPYKTLDGRIDGAVLALVDINDLKQSLKEVKVARGEADKANRAKDLFLATLSHELRTPLTAILSWAQMLRSGKLDAEKVKRAGQIIEDCGNTQAELISDLLDVSRIIVGKLSLEMSEVNPCEIISKTIESVHSTAVKNSVQIETFFDRKTGTVMADRTRLQQVFSNLLTNAIKFSSPNSIIVVSVGKAKASDGEKAKILIKIKDSGKGIRAEFIPYIFDRFSQEDSSSIRIHGGMGLGLAIVRNLVELHGGTVLAESPGENLGATFTVILPMKSEFNSPDRQEGHTHSVSRSIPEVGEHIQLEGLRVLIVDDQASSRDSFKESLHSLGAEIQTAESAQAALKLLERFRPHVLVSDIAMPEEDGYSLIGKIRALSPEQGGNIPAVALTAYASPEDIQQAISAGFQAHLSKPVNGYYLAEVIAKLAGRKVNHPFLKEGA
ncbi:MAG: ATP-binding protein, partial [Bdellovibrionia bacterium]